MYRVYNKRPDFSFLKKFVCEPIMIQKPANSASTSEPIDDFQKQMVEIIGNNLSKKLMQSITEKCAQRCKTEIDMCLAKELRNIVQKCVEENVCPDFQSMILENFNQLIPSMSVSIPSVNIEFWQEPTHNDSEQEQKLKSEFLKLIPLFIREKVDGEIISEIASFQQELSKPEMISYIDKIRRVCQNDEIERNLKTIESLLSNYTQPMKSPAQSIKFVINESTSPERKNEKSLLRAGGDPFRGDLPIVPMTGNWFVPSAHPNVDLQSALMNISG